MHAHDYETGEADAARRGREGEHEREAPLVGLRERRPDVLGGSALLRLQRVAGNGAVSGLVDEERSPVLDVVNSGGGRSLEPGLRSDMEGRLGADFGDVKVHTGADAHASAASVGAHAYTVGSNIVFQRDAYDPGSLAGQTTIAHELTHVVQQRSGPVDGTPSGGGVSVSSPSDRFERAAADNASRVMAAPSPAAAVQREEAMPLQRVAVQREEEGEEEPVQGLFVQREDVAQREEEEDEGAPG